MLIPGIPIKCPADPMNYDVANKCQMNTNMNKFHRNGTTADLNVQ
jgi:hypothetical protein